MRPQWKNQHTQKGKFKTFVLCFHCPLAQTLSPIKGLLLTEFLPHKKRLSSMDPRLERAAESGSIDELYALIDENPHILEKLDAVPFVNTPLHVAAASGNIQFAMEMLNLKPSFARKLNTSGYSPLHLAVDKDHTDFVCRMLWLDQGLASVKGRNGITPFLLLVSRGNLDLVLQCLLASPECIQDVSVNGHNALHLAVMNDRFEVLQVLTGWIQRVIQRNSTEMSVLNRMDFSNNTPLHLAAYKNDHQAVRLLLECRFVERNSVNGDGLTCLDILRTGGGVDLDFTVSKGCKEAASMPKSKPRFDFLKSPIDFWTYCSTAMRRLRINTSDEARGVFLIVCTLILTSTYQTALQPPGGVHQSNDGNVGSVVMKKTFFILLWVTNTVGFCAALFYTFCLLPLGHMFTVWFLWIGASLCVAYALSMAVISPHPLMFLSATFTCFLLFALYLSWEYFVSHWYNKHHRKVIPEPRLSWFWNGMIQRYYSRR